MCRMQHVKHRRGLLESGQIEVFFLLFIQHFLRCLIGDMYLSLSLSPFLLVGRDEAAWWPWAIFSTMGALQTGSKA